MRPRPDRPIRDVDSAHVEEGIICVEHVTFRFPDGTLALEDINLHVARGSTLAIIGPNGAGKTTLLKIILGLLTEYEGQVRVDGLSPVEARRRGDVVSWVPQRKAFNWDLPVSARQVARMGLVGRTGLFRLFARRDLAFVEHVLAILEIGPYADRPIAELSGGQQPRAIIARSLAPQPRVLLLDEPTDGVDQAGRQAFFDLVSAIKREFGLTVAIVTHDLPSISGFAQRIACLNRTLHFHDVPERLTSAQLERTFQCDIEGYLHVDRRIAAEHHAHEDGSGGTGR